MESVWQDTVAQSIGLNLNDPNVYSLVRVGWQTLGQPGIGITDNVIFVRCEPQDTMFSRLRNSVITGQNPNLSVNYTDAHTRTWNAIVTVYGPNSLDNSRAIVAAISDVSFFDTFLSSYNVYINPDIEQPRRVPEVFQGEWWERVDITIEFNEQITEVFTVGTVGTVVVTTYDKNGELTYQTITV